MKRLLDEVRLLPAGDYCECGVYQGDSAKIIYREMVVGSQLFLFDSFAGHPPPSSFDNVDSHPEGRYADTDVELVKKKVPEAIIYKGFFPEHFSEVGDRPFRFVHVDCDLYESTKMVIDFFMPLLVPGGIMRFDDYGAWDCPGCKLAVQERGIPIASENETEFYFQKAI